MHHCHWHLQHANYGSTGEKCLQTSPKPCKNINKRYVSTGKANGHLYLDSNQKMPLEMIIK